MNKFLCIFEEQKVHASISSILLDQILRSVRFCRYLLIILTQDD